jgi:RND family efflux transporter MFP subunit
MAAWVAIVAVNLPSAEAQAPSTVPQQRTIKIAFTEPFETSDVAAADPGIVSEILVREGQSVRAGEILAQLDQRVLAQTLRVAQVRSESSAKVNAARAVLDRWAKQKANFEQLIADGHANPSEVEKVLSEYESALAQLELAEDEHRLDQIEVDRIRAQIDQRTIRSPMDGVVTKIHHEVGEQIPDVEPTFATVVRLDRLKACFYLGADDLDQLKNGMPVTVWVGESHKKIDASIYFVSPVIDPDSGTGRVEVVFDNQDLSIRSGIVCYWGDDSVVANGNSQLHTSSSVPTRTMEPTTSRGNHE